MVTRHERFFALLVIIMGFVVAYQLFLPKRE